MRSLSSFEFIGCDTFNRTRRHDTKTLQAVYLIWQSICRWRFVTNRHISAQRGVSISGETRKRKAVTFARSTSNEIALLGMNDTIPRVVNGIRKHAGDYWCELGEIKKKTSKLPTMLQARSQGDRGDKASSFQLKNEKCSKWNPSILVIFKTCPPPKLLDSSMVLDWISFAKKWIANCELSLEMKKKFATLLKRLKIYWKALLRC